jgi:hypothetical protein
LHREQRFLAGSTAVDIEHRYQLAASPISGTRRPTSPSGSLGCRQRVSGSGKLARASTPAYPCAGMSSHARIALQSTLVLLDFDARRLENRVVLAIRHAPARDFRSQVRVHDLEHTFGRRLRAAGAGFEDRQDLLGHRSRGSQPTARQPTKRGSSRRPTAYASVMADGRNSWCCGAHSGGEESRG